MFNYLSSGATKPVYAPEPFDVGRVLQAEITFGDQTTLMTTASAIDPGLSRFLICSAFRVLFNSSSCWPDLDIGLAEITSAFPYLHND